MREPGVLVGSALDRRKRDAGEMRLQTCEDVEHHVRGHEECQHRDDGHVQQLATAKVAYSVKHLVGGEVLHG